MEQLKIEFEQFIEQHYGVALSPIEKETLWRHWQISRASSQQSQQKTDTTTDLA